MTKILLLLFLIFAANILQAITGFAGTLLAMPFSIFLIGVNESKVLLNLIGLAASIIIVVKDRKYINRRELLRISLFMAAGILGGVLLLNIVQADFLLYFYGVFLICFALYKLASKNAKPISSKLLRRLILLAAGVIHGMFISGGSLLVLYAVSILPDKREFRATLSGVWVVLNTLLIFQHIINGYFNIKLVLISLLGLLPLLLALKLGAWLHTRVKQQHFLRITYILLLISGFMLLQ